MVDADMVSCCLHALVLSICRGSIVGIEELELHYRCRGRSDFRKIRIATSSVGMVHASTCIGIITRGYHKGGTNDAE